MSTLQLVCARATALALLVAGCGDANLGGLKDANDQVDDEAGDGDAADDAGTTGDDDDTTSDEDDTSTDDDDTTTDDDDTTTDEEDTTATYDGGTEEPDASEPADDDDTDDELRFCQFASKDTVPQEDIDAHLAARKTVRDARDRWRAADHAHYKYRRSFHGGDEWHDIEVLNGEVVRVEDVYLLQDMAPEPDVVEGAALNTHDWTPNPPPTVMDPLFEECLERLCIDSKANHPYLTVEVDEFGALRTCRTGGEVWSLDLYFTKL